MQNTNSSNNSFGLTTIKEWKKPFPNLNPSMLFYFYIPFQILLDERNNQQDMDMQRME
jgi:hypothetical protein